MYANEVMLQADADERHFPRDVDHSLCVKFQQLENELIQKIEAVRAATDQKEEWPKLVGDAIRSSFVPQPAPHIDIPPNKTFSISRWRKRRIAKAKKFIAELEMSAYSNCYLPQVVSEFKIKKYKLNLNKSCFWISREVPLS